MLLDQDIRKAGVQICSRCIYDERVSGITFDADGVCNYCHQVDRLKEEFGTGSSTGEASLQAIVEEIKKAGRGKPYDCIIGVSGGTDSSYMVYLAKEWGLRPLAVHYDNTWNSAIATENIRKVLSALDVDLYTHVVDNKEADDIFHSFFKSGVAEIESSTDLALAETMYRAAWKFRIRYVLEGHSFTTEGITPVGRNYFDGKYIQSIHRLFGTRKMKSYPLMTFRRMLWWTAAARIRKIRPFWYMNYSKERAKGFLEQRFGWKYYGGHHLENRMTAFLHSIYLPGKFSTDMRNNTLAALAREGALSREEAWAEYNTPPVVEDELVSYFKKRLGITDEEFDQKMSEPPRAWWEFPTYKKRFELFRPVFAVLSKANLVPMSFYLKYCFPAPIEK
ncbi:N-acetyl sugar amidotransferase [Sphingomonas naasensis]|uniref:N-acetyl sugar amidotransferase n=1 Tax=Sphingomonas naasensis TaxID=1344951 RepID=A0A4V3QXH8_9SPHN|nr:N-acetyl sugar amidotransferase [Sphingomonas naasensis]NIJ19297.1 N-acetyl sugar amidotransferase [Sphingomonas naasensis]TGX46472.1 N-acetyl sugar amidotransferase [Sphingomonas naasensis]